ncbi:hypothetical protein CPB84DRAFT_1848266 [Gymnopilus junonius]|uniref:PinX1-related protein 1 n=1 Tax=Gymnopilus junonius TaxID=109634 RepID=A0A9P5NLE0_GYMJU|nr:hypothetical protein CPB84DRAFT_1848266 [Gymnopilus junonius]
MGLAGRKVKQRIPNDPRNLSWADDAARFGSNYLAKFGWDASKGLGASGDGRLSHIKVTQKLDMMGIGGAHQNDPNGIAWKQNRDFENLLKRLNENSETQTQAETIKIDGFKRAQQDKEAVEDLTVHIGGEKKKKKRKDKEGGEDESERKKKKRKKGENDEDVKAEVVAMESTNMDVDKVVEEEKVVTVWKHRARAIAAKNISSKSAAHISEILGIAPTPSSSSTPSSEGKLTSLTDVEGQLEMEKITTSTKSLADYFKEKLAAKSSGSVTPTFASPSTPADRNDDDAYDMPRMGLGSSRVRLEVQAEAVTMDEVTQRVGLSKFSALMSSSFLASTSLPSTFTPAATNLEEEARHSEGEEKEPEVKPKEEKKKKKEKKSKKDAVEKREQGAEEKRRKKEKKDKKGKDKAVDPEVDEPVVEKAEKKKKKKDKKRKADEENAIVGLDSTKADEDEVQRPTSSPDESGWKEKKEKKRKGKSEVSDSIEVEKKPRKEQKKKHRTSDDDS